MQEKPIKNEEQTQEASDELYERFNLTVDKGQEPLRIDKFLMNRLENATRNKLQQAINASLVLVNGKDIRPNYKVKPGDADNCRRAQRRSVIHFERCNFVAFRSITC